MERQELIKKIEELPPDRLAEVKSFVDSLTGRDCSSSLDQSLTDYARSHPGTAVDLDPELEAASTEHLLQADSLQWSAANCTGLT